ncbi:MAG TPA: SGNH/GDSL hydrolase family protein [Puia sp.]|nr:SGNH/GDSL hydrolase family protein [Puia sp.]
MRTLLSLSVVLLLLSCPSQAQTQTKRIVVIGSSTAAGAGASTDAKAWVALVNKFYTDLHLLTEPIHNLAVSGYTTYKAMPDGYVPPDFHDGNPRDLVDPAHNVSAALRLNPDIVIVAFPTNDLAKNYTMTEFLSNLQTIYNTVTAAGAVCWVTGSQPRDFGSLPARQQLQTANNLILAQFPIYGLDFYSVLTNLDPNSTNYLGIKPEYEVISNGQVDGIHVNDLGHAAIAVAAESANVIGATPLALTLLSFTASLYGPSALLNWTTAGETGLNYFIPQHSADGVTFDDLGRVDAKGGSLQIDYSWTDQHPLTGKNFYRLKMVEDGKETFSKIVSLSLQTTGLNIAKLYIQGSELQAEINLRHDQLLTLTITNTLGGTVRQQTVMGQAPSKKIPVSMAGLAAGQYFLKVCTASGEQATRAFLSF